MCKTATKFLLIFVFIVPVILNAATSPQEKVFRFDTPWLGVMVKDLSEKTLKNMGLDNGVQITKVYDNSPAEKAGLETDDILFKFDDNEISSSKNLVENVKKSEVGDEVVVDFLRSGEKESCKVTIKKRKVPQVYMKSKPKILKNKFYHSQNSVFLGVKVEKLTDQLRDYFKVDGELGVLVAEVIEDSPAEKSGLKAGDVITKIEDREIKNYNDLIRGLNYFDPGNKVDIYFVRDKSNKSIEVILAEPEDLPKDYLRFDDNEYIHDFDFDFDIEKSLDEFDKEIRIKKEIREKDEAK